MKLSQVLVGTEITTKYTGRKGVVTSINRRPVSDYVGDSAEFAAYLVKFSPRDENGIVNENFYNFTTVYYEMEV